VFRRLLISVVAVAFVLAIPAASADEPLGRGFEGSFRHKGGNVIYGVRGEVTAEHAHFDLGSLGEVDVEVKSTGGTETVRSECGGKPLSINGAEYVGRIEFRSEAAFSVGPPFSGRATYRATLKVDSPVTRPSASPVRASPPRSSTQDAPKLTAEHVEAGVRTGAVELYSVYDRVSLHG
jgi:hypothetical protein